MASYVVQLIICLVVCRSFWVWFELQANRSATTWNCAFGRTVSAHITPHNPSLPRTVFCSNELFLWFLLRLWRRQWCCLVSVEWTQPSKVTRVNGFSVLSDRDTVGSDRCLISPASLSCLSASLLWANKADGEVKECDCWEEKIVVQLTVDSFTATDRVFMLSLNNLLIGIGWNGMFVLASC